MIFKDLPIRFIIPKDDNDIIMTDSINIQQQKEVNKQNPTFSEEVTVGNLPREVAEFFEARIEAEEDYCRELLRLNNRFPNLEAYPLEIREVLEQLKGVHSQKYSRTVQFVKQLQEAKENFRGLVGGNTEELQKAAACVKVSEMGLRSVMEKMEKIGARGE
jgi:hypothetical protein